MKINIQRLDSTDYGIFGHLVTDNGFDCVTLERDDIEIPCGTYKAVLYKSQTKGDVLLLKDVPGRTFIEIHAGNKEMDSKGCILVGKKRTGFLIESSRVTLKALLEKCAGCEDITVTIQ